MYLPTPSTKPFAPFRTLPDFQFTELAVSSLMAPKYIDEMLNGIHNDWSRTGTNLTIRNHQDMEQSLKAAREYAVPVSTYQYKIILA